MRAQFWITLTLAAAVLTMPGCSKSAERTAEVVAVNRSEVPLKAADSGWDSAPEHAAKLLLQDLVEPRLMEPSTSEVLVRAITNGADIAFRMEWKDASQSDRPGPAKFIDGCAVQLPQKRESDAPDPQMGQDGRPVEIAFWRADWQASVNGRGGKIQDLYPNATVDHYPFEAKSLAPGSPEQKEMERRYSPADASGNLRGGPRSVAVEDMIAHGPGTLRPATSTTSKAEGVRTKNGWMVVIRRKMPDGLAGKQRTQIAFAVWEGGAGEVGSRKMRTGWIPLGLRVAK